MHLHSLKTLKSESHMMRAKFIKQKTIELVTWIHLIITELNVQGLNLQYTLAHKPLCLKNKGNFLKFLFSKDNF